MIADAVSTAMPAILFLLSPTQWTALLLLTIISKIKGFGITDPPHTYLNTYLCPDFRRIYKPT
jgi:hypothetical protein